MIHLIAGLSVDIVEFIEGNQSRGFIARSALSPPWCQKICCPSVRPFVRPFVRIIIVFCEEDMKDGRVLMSTGSLNS